jgi:hypothetical protein
MNHRMSNDVESEISKKLLPSGEPKSSYRAHVL